MTLPNVSTRLLINVLIFAVLVLIYRVFIYSEISDLPYVARLFDSAVGPGIVKKVDEELRKLENQDLARLVLDNPTLLGLKAPRSVNEDSWRKLVQANAAAILTERYPNRKKLWYFVQILTLALSFVAGIAVYTWLNRKSSKQ